MVAYLSNKTKRVFGTYEEAEEDARRHNVIFDKKACKNDVQLVFIYSLQWKIR